MAIQQGPAEPAVRISKRAGQCARCQRDYKEGDRYYWPVKYNDGRTYAWCGDCAPPGAPDKTAPPAAVDRPLSPTLAARLDRLEALLTAAVAKSGAGPLVAQSAEAVRARWAPRPAQPAAQPAAQPVTQPAAQPAAQPVTQPAALAVAGGDNVIPF